MSDSKRSGGDAPADETEAFLRWLEGVPDATERYRRATDELERHQRAVERLSELRAAAAADAYESAGSIRGLASEWGVSPTRAHQLIQEGQSAQERTAKKKSTKRRSPDRQKGGA